MKLQVALGLMLSGISSLSMAAVSAEEAAKLGDTLTRVGAIAAGNEAGTIPAYEGGLRTAPPGFEPDSGVWVDPFANEKPLFRITAENMAEHADKLSDGQKEVLKRNPDYYMDIYPTHRTAAYPEEVLQATVRNATECETKKDGLAVETDCRGGIPFPIPQTGNEVMWNQLLRYNDGKFGTTTSSSNTWVVDSNGGVTKTATQSTFVERPYYQTDVEGRDPEMAYRVYSLTKAPARKAGELTGLNDYLDPTVKPRRAWSYTPGQRRVKLAPEFAYDTPVASMGGLELFDELFMFSGVQDRFDFKLVGKKEMYIPYNTYKFYFDCDDQLKDSHPNPACERWELHRVWEVEATLKPGMRHVYSKRTYYLDEDTYGAGLYDAWDQSGQLYRAMMLGGVQFYDHDIPYIVKHSIYDFNKGMYGVINDGLDGGYRVLTEPRSERSLNPEAIVMRETQR
ncbi:MULTISPECIES: DUF1329 domain-containing protein [Pseudomonadaceae]|uniref:DUF1329 domain-containing protein n=1 Tax=Pseudomonadaceae TaxID=135621 RepID=UPI001039014D|nr:MULTISPECIES: DUF1329 domain-containing protein [Pseudomonadaceae]MBA1277958.1 DUF1329 domain-containing protein [Stutzerimonas stutzeri]MCW3148695.1 DUF1329 domain-containing protein [Stutzerimonas sp. S1]TCD23714.1 DUF1329 domain-containing protein [Pseudomonas sp. IC_126]